jgi:hypothetical protein
MNGILQARRRRCSHGIHNVSSRYRHGRAQESGVGSTGPQGGGKGARMRSSPRIASAALLFLSVPLVLGGCEATQSAFTLQTREDGSTGLLCPDGSRALVCEGKDGRDGDSCSATPSGCAASQLGTTAHRVCAPSNHPHYDGAFVLDPGGHNIEAVCHEAE